MTTQASVLIIVIDELGAKTIIDTSTMGPEHPLGDHVLAAMHRLQFGFGGDVDRCMKKLVGTLNEVSRVATGLFNLLNTTPPEAVSPEDVPTSQTEVDEVIPATPEVAPGWFDGSQEHWHDGDGWCVDETGKFFPRPGDTGRSWHSDDHHPDNPANPNRPRSGVESTSSGDEALATVDVAQEDEATPVADPRKPLYGGGGVF